MKKSKPIVAGAMVAILILTMMMAGCGSKQAATNEISSATGPFSWTMAKGQTINIVLCVHPYATAIIKQLPQFEQMTGITVKYTMVPSESYFDKVSTLLSGRNNSVDVFMTGAYNAWEYASGGYIQDLNPLINNTSLTSPDYDISDFVPGVLNGDKWDLKAGDPVGAGEQLAIPMGFENYPIAYNINAFKKAGITSPPKTLQELYQDAVKLNGWNGPGSYGIVVRGYRSWDTIHPGFMSAYTEWGGKDFTIQNGKLVSAVDSPQSVQFTQLWCDMIHKAGPPGWASYGPDQVDSDFGAGKAAIYWDADIGAYFQDEPGASHESGNIAWAMPPAGPNGQYNSNEYVWSLAMDNYSQHKIASWLFIQWATSKQQDLWGAEQGYLLDPARMSVWNNQDFTKLLSGYPGYYSTFKALYPYTTIDFTPQPDFFQVTTEWASTLQDIVAGTSSTGDALKTLANNIDQEVANIQVQ